MSYFYLKPIQGNISLHLLEECVLQRWQYFQDCILDSSQGLYQYVIEGSAYDNIGHFMLNYLSLNSGDREFTNFVMKNEELLFYNRLKNGSANDIRLLCKHILKYTKRKCYENSIYLDVLDKLCMKLMVKHVAQHVSDKNHHHNCSIYSIDSHFTVCHPLIANRQVEIDKGIAKIPCNKWKYFFGLLFRFHLNNRNSSFKPNKLEDLDPRWKEIILKMTHNISHNRVNVNWTFLKHSDIDEKLKLFPLCMKNLHLHLRKKHRLSHNERFRYSLFLKDIGMPIQESIHFWQKEYSKPGNNQSVCVHSWERDWKKYMYGIRHLYGLEGARKQYCMVGCKAIQSKSSSLSEGGCPFKHSDVNHLKNLVDFNVVNLEVWGSILEKIKNNRSNDACTIYKAAILDHFHSNVEINSLNVLSPVNYFIELATVITT